MNGTSDRRQRLEDLAERLGVDAILLGSPASVTWQTGFANALEMGESPFELPPLGLWLADRGMFAIVSADAEPALDVEPVEIVTYPGFGLEDPDPAEAAARIVADLAGDRRIAVESGRVPAVVADRLDGIDVSYELARLRAVKDPDEIEAIQSALALCDVGQAAARSLAKPGLGEIELWAGIRLAMENAAGDRLPIIADLVSGNRTAEVGGPPGSGSLPANGPILCDLVPRLNGYWGDSCATFWVGDDPDQAFLETHARVREALDRTVAAIAPGAVPEDLDRLARETLDFPHHTGHGLGTLWHEWPRVVPEARAPLEENMVLALEPGVYEGGFGVRLEQVVLVGADGPEILSGHDLGALVS